MDRGAVVLVRGLGGHTERTCVKSLFTFAGPTRPVSSARPTDTCREVLTSGVLASETPGVGGDTGVWGSWCRGAHDVGGGEGVGVVLVPGGF